MSLQSVPRLSFDFFPSRPVEVEISASPLTSDAGLLPIRQFDERIRLTEQFAAALDDRRDPTFVEHSLLSMVRQRIYGILADYEDQNDHDTLRPRPRLQAHRRPPPRRPRPRQPADPLAVRERRLDRRPVAAPRRTWSTSSSSRSTGRPGISPSTSTPSTTPPTAQQQLIMFHGYYEQYQYLPIVFTCAENDMVLLVGLRHGTCEASLGADNDLRYLVGRLRAVWPDVHIHVRGDSGLGVPRMYDVCRELGLSYTFGIGMNSRLRDLSDGLLKEAVADYERTGSAATAVPRGPVSGRDLGVRAARRHQGRGPRPGDQSAGRGHEPAGLGGPSRRRSTTSTPSGARARTATRN